MIKTSIEDIERVSSRTLPESVKILLACDHSESRFLRGTASWRVFSAQELVQTLESRNLEGAFFSLVRRLSLRYAEHRRPSVIEDVTGKKYSAEYLADTITFAEGAGDFLFLNPDDGFSVWIFYSDGGQIERVAESLWEWISSCEQVISPSNKSDKLLSLETLPIIILSGIRKYIDFLIQRGDIDEGNFKVKVGRTSGIQPEAAEVINAIADAVAKIHSLDHDTDRVQREKIRRELSEFLQKRALEQRKHTEPDRS